VRWWNVKHPTAYAQRLSADGTPEQDREELTAEDRRVERIMLELRLREGLPADVLKPTGLAAAHAHVDGGLLVVADDRFVLTERGRLLADAVIRDLVD
jgi:oxygen-independent coproporphyrinogen-3 oxidase